MKKIHFLCLLFLFAFLIRFAFCFIFPVQAWDGTVYSNLGYKLSNNLLDYNFEGPWSDAMPWGGWPKAGFRPPVLPYSLALLYLLKLNILIEFFIPFIGALSAVFVFLLAESLFNRKIGLYSSILFALAPVHVLYSGRVLTDVYISFFIILTMLCFWKVFEENKGNYSFLFGLFFAMAILTRYTALWFIPVFLIYFLIRDKNLNFIKDKHIWYSIVIFFIVMMPWLIYGQIEYGTPLGPFIHGKQGADAGYIENWTYYFINSFGMFSILSILFLISLIYFTYTKKVKDRPVLFLILWFFVFFIFALATPYKEQRFLVPIVAPLVILVSKFIYNLKKKDLWFLAIALILIFSLFSVFMNHKEAESHGKPICFMQGIDYLKKIDDRIVIVNDNSPIVFYYTRQLTSFYPATIDKYFFEEIAKNNNVSVKEIYVFYSDYNYPLAKKGIELQESLNVNVTKVFECSESGSYSVIFKNS